MRLTEQDLKAILQNKPGFWQEIAARIVREARRQGSRATSPLSGVPDSTIFRASSLPVNESREKSIRIAMDSMGKLADHPGQSCSNAHPDQTHDQYVDDMDDDREEEERGRTPTFDSTFEIQTIKRNRKVRFQRPEIRTVDRTQRHVVDSLSMERGATETAAIRQLLDQWNAGKQPEPEPVRKIVIRRHTRERGELSE